MSQTWENGKKTSFGPNFGPFGPHLGPKIFFEGFTSTRHCSKLSSYVI